MARGRRKKARRRQGRIRRGRALDLQRILLINAGHKKDRSTGWIDGADVTLERLWAR